jgi:hypothetical protein
MQRVSTLTGKDEIVLDITLNMSTERGFGVWEKYPRLLLKCDILVFGHFTK